MTTQGPPSSDLHQPLDSGGTQGRPGIQVALKSTWAYGRAQGRPSHQAAPGRARVSPSRFTQGRPSLQAAPGRARVSPSRFTQGPPWADSGEDRAGDLIKVQIIVLFHNRQSPQRPCTSRQRSLPLISRRLGHFIEDKVVDPRLPSSEPASRFAKAARWRLDDLSMDQGSPGSKTGSDLDGTHPLTLRRRGKHSRITLSTSESPIFPPRGCRGHATLQ